MSGSYGVSLNIQNHTEGQTPCQSWMANSEQALGSFGDIFKSHIGLFGHALLVYYCFCFVLLWRVCVYVCVSVSLAFCFALLPILQRQGEKEDKQLEGWGSGDNLERKEEN